MMASAGDSSFNNIRDEAAAEVIDDIPEKEALTSNDPLSTPLYR